MALFVILSFVVAFLKMCLFAKRVCFSVHLSKKKKQKKKNGKKRKKDRKIDYLNMSFTHIPELMIDRPLFEVFIPRA